MILSKDHPEVLETCVRSLRHVEEGIPFEMIVMDNGSNPEHRARYEALAAEYDFAYYYEEKEFNFSAQCNAGVMHATGDYICLLNDDTEIITPGWIGKMCAFAEREQIGAVGAKLLYAGTNLIQHVGVTNMAVGPSHKLLELPDDVVYANGRNRGTWNCLAVTGACLVVRKDLYEKVGGLDEALRVAYNDIDFCMKLTEAGYRNVQCNEVVLYHAESLSRGADQQDDAKWTRLLAEKEKLYTLHPQFRGFDPYYHKDWIGNDSRYLVELKHPMNAPSYQTQELFLQPSMVDLFFGKSSRGLEGRLDRIGFQRRLSETDCDTIWMDGWCLARKQDNAAYVKHILMEGESGRFVFRAESIYRADVAELFPKERHQELAGFFLRIKAEELPEGVYRVGLCMDGGNGREWFTMWFDQELIIPVKERM